MTESNQFAQDLHFVRSAVEARDRRPGPQPGAVLPWIAYCLICIPAYDLYPSVGGRINLIGWITAAIISGFFRKRAAARSGQYDRQLINRTMLHWFGGVTLLLVAVFGIAWTNPRLSSVGAGQISIILVGFLYFTAGIHLPDVRFMRWAGPLIVLAGIAMAFIPHGRWTAVGVIFAICLTLPLLFSRRTVPSATQQ